MLRRSPLRRKAPLRRKRWMRRSSKTSKYARRPRDVAYMRWCRLQGCVIPRWLWENGDPRAFGPDTPYPCDGPLEADHAETRAGGRGLGQKGPDRTCITLCKQHHLERTSFSGFFADFTQERMRTWTLEQINLHNQRYDELRRDERGSPPSGEPS